MSVKLSALNRAFRDKIEAESRMQMFVRFGLPKPVAEHRFLKDRRFRFDFAWPEHVVALEIEGGIWTGGRHTRGAGYLRDCEKYNLAAVNGWKVIRTTPDEIFSTATMALLKRVIPC